MPFPFDRKPAIEQILQQWLDWANYVLINGWGHNEDERPQLKQMMDRTEIKLRKLKEE